jgi:hypothetical protein
MNEILPISETYCKKSFKKGLIDKLIKSIVFDNWIKTFKNT